ncbi:MAG: acyltransferase family protein [Pyrinomonadaceae bacterium]
MDSECSAVKVRAFQLGYRPSIDGLRGIAVLGVMAFHTYTPFTQGGFIGVDVFFVLSGFLITSLLLQEWDQSGAIRLKNFYARRVLRLFPALFSLSFIWFLYISLFQPEHLRKTSKDILIVLLYSANWSRALGQEELGWKDSLGHTWSLSIEEQFYLVWPALLFLMLQLRLQRRWILSLLVMGIAASALSRAALWASGSSVARLFNGLDSRADALLIGCAVGLLVTYNLLPGTRWFLLTIKGLALGSALILAYLGFQADGSAGYMYLGGFTLVAGATAIILIELLGSPSNLVLLVLESPLLVWIGRLSYGLYLWHLPLYRITVPVVTHPDWTWYERLGLRFVVTFAVASLSFYLIERPCLKMKQRFRAVQSKSH